MQEDERSRKIRNTANTGIITNVVLGLVKIAIGFLSGSVAVISDGANNATDSVSSLVTLIGYRISRKKPTKEHPLGFGRIEYLSALLVGILILLTGFSFLSSSIDAVRTPHDMSVSAIMIAVLSLTVAAKVWLWKLNTKIGRETGSEALEASGADALSDVLTSSVTILAAFLAPHTALPVDGWAGILISLFIIWNGISSILSTSLSLLGERPDKGTVEKIRAIIEKHPPLMGGYDIRIHSYGPEDAMGTVDVEVPYDTPSGEAAEAIAEAAKDILQATGISFTFGINAVDNGNEAVNAMKEKTLRALQMASSDCIGIHGFHVHENEKRIDFDLVIDFRVKDREKFRRNIQRIVEKLFPSYSVEFNLDPDYS